MASVVVTAGVVAMLVALFSSSSSPNSDNPRQSSNRAVEPVAPIDPQDPDANPPAKDVGKALDLTNPFASSFGKAGRREVTVRITSNGAVNVGIYYRDKKRSTRQVTGAYSVTRTVEGRYPLAAVALQLPGNLPGTASRATCTIIIDGIKVTTRTAKKAGALT
ncbi:MAG: hypothetical protein ACRDOT_07635, partial [Aeromicrobium sp.]